MTLTDDDYNHLVQESLTFITKVPWPVKPFVPSLQTILGWIPARLHKYTVKEIMEAFSRAEAAGHLPRRL